MKLFRCKSTTHSSLFSIIAPARRGFLSLPLFIELKRWPMIFDYSRNRLVFSNSCLTFSYYFSSSIFLSSSCLFLSSSCCYSLAILSNSSFFCFSSASFAAFSAYSSTKALAGAAKLHIMQVTPPGWLMIVQASQVHWTTVTFLFDSTTVCSGRLACSLYRATTASTAA